MRVHRTAAVLVLVLLTAACTGGAPGTGEESEGGEQVVNYLTVPPETVADEEIEVRLIEQFEEDHPEIRVERQTMPVDEMRTVIQTQLRSGEGPDVFTYDTGPGFAGVLADAGLLYDLTPVYEERGWDVYDWAKERVTYDGQVMGLPNEVEEIGVFYNEEMLSGLGLQPPETVEELQQAAAALRGDGKIPFAFGNSEQWPAAHQFSMVLNNILGQEGVENLLFGDGRWDSPEVAQAIDLYFQRFRDDGFFPDSPNAIAYQDANSLFYSEQAAMLPSGTWLVSEIEDTTDFEVGFIPFPSIDGKDVFAPTGLGNGTFVAAQPRSEDAAVEFLDFLLSEDVARTQVEELQTIPAHPVDTADVETSPLFREVLDDLQASASGGLSGFGYNLDVLLPARVNDTMFSGLQEVLNGQRSPQELAAALQAAWDEAKRAGEVGS